MKKIFITLLLVIVMLAMVGCNKTQIVNTDNVEIDKNQIENPTVNSGDDEFFVDIYACDEVYKTEETKIYGKGSVDLTNIQDNFEVFDCQLLLCEDKCNPADVVSRMSQGYAAVYQVALDEEFDGNYKTQEFKMVIPEGMIDEFENQENEAAPKDGNYYYLLTLDETHYAYVHIGRKEGLKKIENEAEVADSIIKNAQVNLEI